MKFSHSVLLGFALILILFSVTTAVNFRLYRAVNANADYISRSTLIGKNSNQFQRNVLGMVNGLRGYLLTGERSFVQSYDEANAENEGLLHELRPLLTDSMQLAALNRIIRLNTTWTEVYTDPLRQAKMLSAVSPAQLDSFKRVYALKYANGAEMLIQQQLQSEFRSFINSEYVLRERRKAALGAAVQRVRYLSIILTFASFLVALVVAMALLRKISRRIGIMTSFANTIAAGNYDARLAEEGRDELTSLGQSLQSMAEKLSANIALLQRSNAELDQFAHVVSHDMKGPLRGIANVVSWIDEDHRQELSPQLAEYIDLISGRVLRAEHLIEGLLSYARADREAVEPEDVDVRELLDEVLDNLPPSDQVAISVGPMPVLHTERILLFQVFSNLVSNAFKHNNRPGSQIRIFCQESPDHYTFHVADNGEGIAEKYHSRIFRIFQTLKERDSFESAGVGLAIVRKILDSKQQTITLESAPGLGADFSFTWPRN